MASASISPGFFTFNPGDGQCRPINLFGPQGATPEASDFVSATTINAFRLEQLSLLATLAGEIPQLRLPGGAVGFAVGAEYRDESSRSRFDPLAAGVIPVDTPDASAGQLGQIQRPKWATSGSLAYRRGLANLRWVTHYQTSQFLRGVNARKGRELYGDMARSGGAYVHDLAASYDFPSWQLYGGVKNVFDRKPFATERASPVTAWVRVLFLGFNIML